MISIAINGLGRIGRKLTHYVLRSQNIRIVAINDIMPIDMAAYFLKHDSTYGVSEREISVQGEYILIDQYRIQYSSRHEISDLPWNNMDINIAINCSGTNKSKPQLSQYLDLGIPRVILSSPPDSEEIPIIILGYNEEAIQKSPILSSASCTTYCVAPILDIFDRALGISYANFTTIHCYTSDQNLQDAYHPDYRRSRAAGVNIIPTSTSATKVIRSIFPHLQDKVSGSSFRVPVINGSITEFIIETKNKANLEDIFSIIQNAKNDQYHAVIDTTTYKIVSSDVIGSIIPCLIDLQSIEIIGENKIKLIAFYDNEAGYSYQLCRLISML